MSTAVSSPTPSLKPAANLPGRRFDHYFFPTMALLMMATVFVGFAHTYYLAGMFHAPLPSRIIHIHGALFTSWILLLITQTSLAAAGRVDIHRRLGIAGFLLACLMVIFGVLAATDSLVRQAGPPGRDPRFFYIIPLGDISIFATLAWFAFRSRKDSPAHKRFIYVATTALLIAAIARWPLASIHGKPPMAMLTSYSFLLILVAYDLWSSRKVHRVTLKAVAFLILVQQLAIPIGQTAAWLAFAGWVQSHARWV
jgi:FtsH-binding integral membrane protein